MIILDENFPDSQRQLLKSWRISFKQIAFELGREGLKDDGIIPLLHQLKNPTFLRWIATFSNPNCATANTVWFTWMSGNMNQLLSSAEH